tara:strand:+ start:1109 stop:3562 length:2454 start_codon:yes stop_codon:yes gene_type:complete
MKKIDVLLEKVASGDYLESSQAVTLAEYDDLDRLMEAATLLRDSHFENVVTYSKKIFIPLTNLCRDVCHYCTFAKAPKKVEKPYMSFEEIVSLAQQGKEMGCKEALFTLGEKPELRYKTARDFLKANGFNTTIEYLTEAAQLVFDETGLLPHMNPGTLSVDECASLRQVAPSMGMMLESASDRLCEKGMPHFGSPDKKPSVRLETLRETGRQRIPFTTGILMGIGETRQERIESLLKIRDIHEEYGHIQEIIIQNFRAKLGTKMKNAPEPSLNDLLWTLSVARLLFGAKMSVQVPPNLSPGNINPLLEAGINDWGGVSPLTPDHVNPEAPWPHLDKLSKDTEKAGKTLAERLTIYPDYIREGDWVDSKFMTPILELVDAEYLPKMDSWTPGEMVEPPLLVIQQIRDRASPLSQNIKDIFEKVDEGQLLNEHEIVSLFKARGSNFSAVCDKANELRKTANGDEVSFVINRNINYTNVCYFKCQFCAFSKGKLSENLRGKPYDLEHDEIGRRVAEAWQRGATEVCMQGGIHPQYTGQTYIDIVKRVKDEVPEMHVHAFSPLEIWQGAETLGITLEEFLQELKKAGLDTLPGTAAEVLDDEVRAVICPDKINTSQWLSVMRAAHHVGFSTTATIMYGHVDQPVNWARHLIRVRDLQVETGGFTEFVPLPFVASESPVYLKGRARRGPSFREAVLMHAVARIVFHGYISNIQTSWVKMGHRGVIACLGAGANDLGGTLMNESITRAAGAAHGQETNPSVMLDMISGANRIPRPRTTIYSDLSSDRLETALEAGELSEIINSPAKKYERRDRRKLIRSSANV